MKPEDLFEQVSTFLPKYLTPTQTEDLYSELVNFPKNKQFYLNRSDLGNDLLQGDAWEGFIALEFNSGQRKAVSGVILSNSCDASINNPRSRPVNVLFSPIIRLAGYRQLLLDNGKPESSVENALKDIRNQTNTSIFYLPRLPSVIDESIILLDDIKAQPLRQFSSGDRKLVFRMNQFMFYLFLIKLSIHFCRFQENVRRFEIE